MELEKAHPPFGARRSSSPIWLSVSERAAGRLGACPWRLWRCCACRDRGAQQTVAAERDAVLFGEADDGDRTVGRVVGGPSPAPSRARRTRRRVVEDAALADAVEVAAGRNPRRVGTDTVWHPRPGDVPDGIDGNRWPSIPEPLDKAVPRPSVRFGAGAGCPPADIGRAGLDRTDRCRRLDIGPEPVGVDPEGRIDITAWSA